MQLTDIAYPKFIYKHCLIAALTILILFIIAFSFMLSSSEKSFEDINHDGEIQWDEMYVAWKLPGTVHWWKYIFGAFFSIWAFMIIKRIHTYDAEQQKIHDAQFIQDINLHIKPTE